MISSTVFSTIGWWKDVKNREKQNGRFYIENPETIEISGLSVEREMGFEPTTFSLGS